MLRTRLSLKQAEVQSFGRLSPSLTRPKDQRNIGGSTGDGWRLHDVGLAASARQPSEIPMLFKRIALSASVVAGLAVLPLSSASAQYYPACSFPLEWPFCIAGAAVGAAATIATAPFRVVAGGPYYYYGSPYYGPAYYYYPRRHYYRRHHYYRHY
jgi:hypothetical protein